jgi:hypothetical protein
VLLLGLSGCGAVKQDVHRYYRQMAENYREAEEKAKFEAVTLEADSRTFLRAGNVHRFNRARKELARLKDWEDRCASQRERFEQAARKLASGGVADGSPPPSPDAQSDPEAGLPPPAG